MIRVACVGAGWAVRAIWLPLFQTLPQWTVVGVADPDPDARAAALEVSPDLAEVAQEDALESLLERVQADVILVASPNDLHVAHAEAALHAGCAVILEKPACFTRVQAETLAALSERVGRPLWVSRASVERRDVGILRDQIAAGAVGPVQAIDLAWLRASGVPRVGTWFTRRASAVGGVLADLGWHMLDVGLDLLDHPRTTAALCSLLYEDGPIGGAAGWLGDRSKAGGASVWPEGAVDVETRAYGSLSTEAGSQLRLSVAWQSHEPRDVTRILVSGRDGMLELVTTFGFSPHGVKQPSLKAWQRGECQDLTPPAEDGHSPYRRFLERVAQDHAARRMPSSAPLIGVADALETLYAAGARA